jgi:hypothetical protein
MVFRKVSSTKKHYNSPLDLFPDIRPRKIAAPYDHQAQLLRDYARKGIDAGDVAIQGATGSGKTFVGLLIAEWRRRQRGERAVYLCPTKQLVHQVSTFAREQMGLPAHAFVGSRAEFSPSLQADWRSGENIAITTFSALFNVNPFFARPNFIVVDDAHAADQYIAEYWTVRVTKHEIGQPPLFEELAAVIKNVLPVDEATRLSEDPRTLSDSLWVQLAPGPLLWKHEAAISAILDRATDRSDLAYRWSVLKGHLRACQFYVCAHEIVIRPVLPPTGEHAPFASAKQRLYMSATLGRGGELERLAGRPSIERLASPSGWNGNGVGRRFFMFPDASLVAEASSNLIVGLIKKSGRALYLTADDKKTLAVRELISQRLADFRVFSARDIEGSKTPFTSEKKAIALIANRYDGIDFPNDECRLLIVEGRPAGASLQERFLADKLGARALFSERIRTRIVQAFGRCTRSANDYALVVAVGHQLMDELLLKENLSLLDGELQAEIHFGREQSQGSSEKAFLTLAELFYRQGDDWRDAEKDIANLRDEMKEVIPSSLVALESAAEHEIEYVANMWNGDYGRALESAQRAIGSLAGGEDLKGYRAWWQYLAGCAAMLDAEESEPSRQKADQHFRLARSVSSVRWLSGLLSGAGGEEREGTPSEDCAAIEAVELQLCELGITREAPFTKKTTAIREGLNQQQAKKFESALEELGDLLGFKANSSDKEGAPDPWWIGGDALCIVFEHHSKVNPGTDLSIEKARQAASHPAWIKANVPGFENTGLIIPVLLTDADPSREECRIHLRTVAVWSLNEFRKWADDALAALRKARAVLSRPGDLIWRAEALRELSAVHATPSTLGRLLRDRINTSMRGRRI